MALTTSLSSWERARVAAAAYAGEDVRVSLANVTGASYTVENSVTDWDSLKVSSSGYTDFTATIGDGGYDTTQGRFELGTGTGPDTYIDAEFTATTLSYTYNRVYVVIGTETYLHSLLTESPSVTVSPGQTITYRIQLAVA
jgi:hypothetical protein